MTTLDGKIVRIGISAPEHVVFMLEGDSTRHRYALKHLQKNLLNEIALTQPGDEVHIQAYSDLSDPRIGKWVNKTLNPAT